MNSETSNAAPEQMWVCSKCGIVRQRIGDNEPAPCAGCGGTFILTDVSHDNTQDVNEQGEFETVKSIQEDWGEDIL